MRIIKFRAWNQKYKVMEEIDDLYWFEENGVHTSEGDGHVERYVLMEFTGAHDCKGIEIYEGDILVSNNQNIFLVEFVAPSFVAVDLFGKSETRVLSYECILQSSLKVKGHKFLERLSQELNGSTSKEKLFTELVEQVTPGSLSKEVDWGSPVGNEVW